ncbi:unnamed protein product [Pleuronectes platessa]|uniref:Uncharacterized protein n=1 Tax=Pleuronectes platessa TaxID=8262 RepID=A0A9N7U3S2_PLEPL|nr:unnamed protein product [Pleuronectes platessa]
MSKDSTSEEPPGAISTREETNQSRLGRKSLLCQCGHIALVQGLGRTDLTLEDFGSTLRLGVCWGVICATVLLVLQGLRDHAMGSGMCQWLLMWLYACGWFFHSEPQFFHCIIVHLCAHGFQFPHLWTCSFLL